MTSPIPPQAITAAAVWLHDEECDDGDTKTCGRWQAALGKRGVPAAPHLRHIEFYRDRAAGALEAAAPHLAAYDPREFGLTASDLRAVADRLYDCADSRLDAMDDVSVRFGQIRSRLRGLADALGQDGEQ